MILKKKIYEDVAKFKKEELMVSIINVETYINDVLTNNDSISFTEDKLIINNKLTSTNKKITYKVTVKNRTTKDEYKLRNITEIINSNNNSSYSLDIDLAAGVFASPSKELTFNITYNYDSSKTDNSYRQILFLDFRWNYTFEATTDRLITLSTPETNTSTTYGDFSAITNTTELTGKCTYDTCYSDNNGNLEYNSEGGLVLDSDNNITVLNIDQSMSVKNSYSLYMTVKGNTTQEPEDYPATIVAISESSSKYLTWVGFYKNYLHVYSYRNGSSFKGKNFELVEDGFISFDISKYSNKVMNIQIVGVRGGNTKVYINGTLLKTFASGVDPVDFKFATIGDLRPGRKLKFTGVVYDLALYNKALSTEEVQTNYKYAKEKWGIS